MKNSGREPHSRKSKIENPESDEFTGGSLAPWGPETVSGTLSREYRQQLEASL